MIYLFIILPIGVVSKNDIGTLNMFLNSFWCIDFAALVLANARVIVRRSRNNTKTYIAIIINWHISIHNN